MTYMSQKVTNPRADSQAAVVLKRKVMYEGDADPQNDTARKRGTPMEITQ
jgi:hypothetical protein